MDDARAEVGKDVGVCPVEFQLITLFTPGSGIICSTLQQKNDENTTDLCVGCFAAISTAFIQTDRHKDRPILLLRTSRRIVNRKDRFAFLIGPILWGHSGPLCHALLLLLWTSILHCQSPGVATVARRLRYSYSCRASAHLGSGVDSSDTW